MNKRSPMDDGYIRSTRNFSPYLQLNGICPSAQVIISRLGGLLSSRWLALVVHDEWLRSRALSGGHSSKTPTREEGTNGPLLGRRIGWRPPG
ncbi:hypothetical protein Trydic_g11031 [Trypoxylus dichotomus]